MVKVFRAHAALILVNCIYGGNYAIAKIVMPLYIKPFGFILLRVSIALVLYAFIHFIFIREKVHNKDIPRLALCGLFGVAINQLMFFKGLSLTNPINAALIMITTPVLVLIISFIVIQEKITIYKILGIVLGAAGAILVISKGKWGFTLQTIKGDLFIMINAVSYGIYLVLVKSLMKKYNAFTVIKWVFFFGFFPVILLGHREFAEINWGSIPGNIWVCITYVVIGTTFIAYMLNIYALKEVNPSIVGSYIYLQPILATLIALAFGKDELKLVNIVSATLIFSGVYLVSMHSFKKDKKGLPSD